MGGIAAIFRKEMEDYFSSVRFVLISALIVMVGVVIASVVGMTIREEVTGMAKPTLLFLYLFTSTGKFFSFVQFIGFSVPSSGLSSGSMPSTVKEPPGHLASSPHSPSTGMRSSTVSSSPVLRQSQLFSSLSSS